MIMIFETTAHQSNFDSLLHDFSELTAVMSSIDDQFFVKSLDELLFNAEEAMILTLTDEAVGVINMLIDLDTENLSIEQSFVSDVIDGVSWLKWANKVPKNLIEAYEGHFEEEMKTDLANAGEKSAILAEYWALLKIYSDEPIERLCIYLGWNGIVGWTQNIFSVITEV